MTVVDGKRGPRLEEPRQWFAHDASGRLNLGSYAVQAAMGTVLLANDLVLQRAKVQQAEHGGDRALPDPDHIAALSRCLLEAADRVQINARPDDAVDRLANSHSRSRAVVRAALDVHPVPWDALEVLDEPALETWVCDLVGTADQLMGLTLDALEPDPTIYWRAAGWVDQEDHDTFLAMVKERSAALPEEAHPPLKVWLRDQGWKAPYRRDELAAWAAHLDEIEEHIEPTPGSCTGATAPAPSGASTGQHAPAAPDVAAGGPQGASSVDAGPSDPTAEGPAPTADDGAGAGEIDGAA